MPGPSYLACTTVWLHTCSTQCSRVNAGNAWVRPLGIDRESDEISWFSGWAIKQWRGSAAERVSAGGDRLQLAPAHYFRALQQTPSSSILPGLHRAAFPASFDPFDEQRHILGICALRSQNSGLPASLVCLLFFWGQLGHVDAGCSSQDARAPPGSFSCPSRPCNMDVMGVELSIHHEEMAPPISNGATHPF